MDDMQRAAGRRRDPRTDTAALNAVLDLIAAGETLSGLSLVTIAEHAGVSRNSLYRRWKTKDALYLDVLDTINRALPEFTGPAVREDLAAYLAALIQRTLDPRAAAVLRALQAEAAAFPELHRRYFDEIVAPRRQAVYGILRRGVDSGELRPDLDVEFVGEILVAPVLARLGAGTVETLNPAAYSRQIVDLLYGGIKAR